MHGFGLGELTQAFEKSGGGGEFASMKLGISAGQPAKVGIVWRRLVGEGRKEAQFRPPSSPALRNVRIEKGEGDVARDSDELSWRTQSDQMCSGSCESGGCRGENGGQVAMLGDKSGNPIEQRVEIPDFLG